MAARKLKPPNQREDLALLREQLQEAMKSAPVAVKAQIAGQLRAVIKDLAALGGDAEEVSVADELANKRAARLDGAPGGAPAARRSQPRRRRGNNRAG